MSGKQQLIISLRGWVGTAFEVHEDFVGLYEMDHGSDAKTITEMITDLLLRLGLPMSNLRGQGYDGASVICGCSMSGVHQGRNSWGDRGMVPPKFEVGT